MGKSEDAGFCLLGASMLLRHVSELQDRARAAKSMDAEGVHQMRVASRRVRAGLPIFSTCFKVGQYDRWRRGIKGVTKALGEARDIDVQVEFLQGLLEKVSDAQAPGVRSVLDSQVQQRKDLQGQVVGWLDNLKDEGILSEMEDRLTKVVQRQEARKADVRSRAGYAAGLANVSLRVVAVLKLEEYVADPQAKEKHHALRIAVKRLRYTLEAFKPLFDDQLKKEIGELKEVQDLLGALHDSDVWLAGIDAIGQDVLSAPGADEGLLRPGLEAIRADRAQERERLYTDFRVRWEHLRQHRSFERLGERFQAGLSFKDIAVPLVDAHAPARLAVISDVHGNLDALNAVLGDAKKEGASAFINLGDMVGTGAYPEEVVKMLSGDHFLGVAGNFDLKVLEFSRASQRSRVRSVKGAIVAAAARDLSEESLNFIASLPPEIRMEVLGKKILLVHASPGDPDEHLGPETPEERLTELGRIADADLVLVGHSHRPFVRTVNDVTFANPGSVGRPGDHDPRASYAILDTGDFSITIHRVEYDVEAAVSALLAKGLPESLGEVLRKGLSSSEIQGRKAVPKSGAARLGLLEIAARKMNVDHEHAEQVLKLATIIYRQLRPVHGLGGKDRFLLEAACLLHDVGIAEGVKGHHRSSYRLIMEQQLPLTPEEKRMVACIARFHRKRPPKDDEPELCGMTSDELRRFHILTSILRVADGLDYQHERVVTDVECTIGPTEVLFRLKATSDHTAEIEAAGTKADLFERTFERKVRFE
jgi:putative phosphoesterase